MVTKYTGKEKKADGIKFCSATM